MWDLWPNIFWEHGLAFQSPYFSEFYLSCMGFLDAGVFVQVACSLAGAAFLLSTKSKKVSNISRLEVFVI